MRPVVRLLAAIVLAAGAGSAATAAPPAGPPSVLEERPAKPAAAVYQEATGNKLYDTRTIGLDHDFAGH